MKTLSIFLINILIILLACSLLLFSRCTKTNSSPVIQRIIAENEIWNDTIKPVKSYTYMDNLITEIVEYNGLTEATGMTEVQYSGDVISSFKKYYKINGTMHLKTFSEITAFAGDNPAEIIEHQYSDEGIEEYQSKRKYYYSGDFLKEATYYSYESGAWKISSSTSYSYDNKGRIGQITTNVHSPIGADFGTSSTYYYEGSLLSEFIVQSYYHVMTNVSKTSFEYTDGMLSKAVTYKWESNNWVKDGKQQYYEYNESGNLVSIRYEDTGPFPYSYKILYIYEEGTGNYRQCINAMAPENFIPGKPWPMPV